MLSMGPILDLAGLKMAFASLVRHAEPNILPSFMLWVDLRVSEFKVTGTLPPALRLGPQELGDSLNMAVEDLQKKCKTFDGGETAETCGTQTSPTSQASSVYARSSIMDPHCRMSVYDSTADHCSVQTVPTDLSIKNKQQSKDLCKNGDYSQRKSLKNIIDGMVKKEALTDAGYNQWSSHMSLPVMMPIMPPMVSAITEHHANLAKLLSNPLMPNETPAHTPCSASPKKQEKHVISPLEDFPHKKFRPDISVPSEQAVCLKGSSCPAPPHTKGGTQYSMKTEPVSPVKSGNAEKENGSGGQQTPLPASSTSPGSHTTSALRELLTSKLSSHPSMETPVVNQDSDKLVIDEDGSPETSEFDSDMTQGTVNEEDLHDRSHHLNTCQVCGQSFHYRSSFRRHMKVHQGIFSHVCAVCGRKFTRKEHFVRHKCSRKPNKASRGAHVESPVAPGITPKIEFPPTPSPEKHSEENSCEGMCQDSPNAVPYKAVHVFESRRKATNPRKVVMVEEQDPEVSCEDEPMEEDQMQDRIKDDGKLAKNDDSSSPAKPNQMTNSPGQHSHKISLSPKQEKELETSTRSKNKRQGKLNQNIRGIANDKENIMNADVYQPDKHQNNWAGDSYSEVLDLSCPQVSSSCSPPQLNNHLDQAAFVPPHVNYNIAIPTQQEFTIETGSYKVVTGAGSELEEGSRNKFIKVVKQGNYLKLKEEAQIIGGQLCFVCPTCSKIFHRSSNFSRHMRIHRGVYSYVCPNCQRGFFRREHFQKHKCSRRGMSHTWDRKTKIDMVLAANESLLEGSDAEGGLEHADSEESFTVSAERLESQ